ncbi:MAG: flavin reductase [Clostridia bacterium]|nr:flavin reductase [Clostridia bacterium]
MDTKVLHNLSYGLFVLSTHLDGKDNACIINTAIQAGSDPLTVSIAVNKLNYTHDLIKESGIFNLSVISKDAKFDLFKRFGFASGREVDKFEGYLNTIRTFNDALVITEGTNSYMSCWVTDTMDIGSHTIFVARVADMQVLSKEPSATYADYHATIKPKPTQSAPSNKTKWRCSVCGYEVEAEELPDDYICPICKHPKSDFVKVN